MMLHDAGGAANTAKVRWEKQLCASSSKFMIVKMQHATRNCGVVRADPLVFFGESRPVFPQRSSG
jgi:hypothetical protein